jgi:Na+/proline symporter
MKLVNMRSNNEKNLTNKFLLLSQSLLSGITYLGIPTEVYRQGSQYFAVCISSLILGVLIAYVVIPHFNNLQISSSYEFLELRFTKSIRVLAASLYIISLIMYIPVVIYVPALACAQVTGYGVHTLTPIFSIVCITYTSMVSLVDLYSFRMIRYLTLKMKRYIRLTG